MSNLGMVPEVQGNGLRLFSGILSVVDIGGNNLLTASAGGVLLGNLVDLTPVVVFSPTTTFFDLSAPSIALHADGATLNQQNTVIRLVSGGNFAISSVTDAAPTAPVENLIAANRNGAFWNALIVGQGGSTFPITSLTSGVTTFTGPVTVDGALNPVGGLISGTSFVANWPTGTPGGIFTLPNTPFSAWLFSVTVAGSNDPTNYNTVCLVTTNGPQARVSAIQQGALMQMSTSGLTVLFTQNNGATANVNSWWTRLV